MMDEVNKVCDAYVKAADEASNEQLKNIVNYSGHAPKYSVFSRFGH